MLLDPNDCSTTCLRNFNTHADRTDSEKLANYLQGLSAGSVLLGVGCDDAIATMTDRAKIALANVGVNVRSLVFGGKLAFAAIIGRKESTKSEIKEKGGNNLVVEATPSGRYYSTEINECVHVKAV